MSPQISSKPIEVPLKNPKSSKSVVGVTTTEDEDGGVLDMDRDRGVNEWEWDVKPETAANEARVRRLVSIFGNGLKGLDGDWFGEKIRNKDMNWV